VNQLERFTITRPLDLQTAVLRCQRSSLLLGASDLERSVIATIVSELGTNLLKYAEKGTLVVRRMRHGTTADVEITASDRGPGIPNIELAMSERYSSGRTLGLGLPGVRRMADDFSIESSPEAGTIVRVRKRLALLPRAGGAAHQRDALAKTFLQGERWSLAGLLQPRRGARLGGDRIIAIEHAGQLLLVVIDVTGHGPVANELSHKMEQRLRDELQDGDPISDPTALLSALHHQCVGTPGAAAALALIDCSSGGMSYLAVGNVRAYIARPQSFRGVSRDGMLGRRWPTPFIQKTQLSPGDHLLVWTDGLPDSLARSLNREVLMEPDLGRLAAQLLAQHGRDHDDAALLLLRWS